MTTQEKAKKLKEQAELMRRAVRHPTTGGHLETKLLLHLAVEFQKKALELEEGGT